MESDEACVSCGLSGAQLFDTKDPNRSALGHLRVIAGEEAVEVILHRPCVPSPTRVHSDVLLPVDGK